MSECSTFQKWYKIQNLYATDILKDTFFNMKESIEMRLSLAQKSEVLATIKI